MISSIKPVLPSLTAIVGIGIYFAIWWALNGVFNNYNKKVLNAFPYLWLTLTLSLACGSLMMLVSWVALAHTIGHVEAIVRCALAAVMELNFNMIGFMGAMISNLAFVFRNIFSKKGMKGKSVSVMNYYACLSMMSLLIVTPFANSVEGPQMWADGWQNDVSKSDQTLSSKWVVAHSVFYHLYNQVSYIPRCLNHHLPNPLKHVNALGAAIAILGTFIYSQIKNRVKKNHILLVLCLGMLEPLVITL
ncbi:putative glucose-6-phosphate/phosphate-translocator [Arabidopsis thaliana]|nr:similar to chloroplast triose phosphate translocators [Arabidopsis thaliana]CAB80818.1 putative glucose-6-phosphate/phosphate-translocator [Arabidopsis thaliana]